MKSAFTHELVPDPLDVKTEEAIDVTTDVAYGVSSNQNDVTTFDNNMCGNIPW